MSESMIGKRYREAYGEGFEYEVCKVTDDLVVYRTFYPGEVIQRVGNRIQWEIDVKEGILMEVKED